MNWLKDWRRADSSVELTFEILQDIFDFDDDAVQSKSGFYKV